MLYFLFAPTLVYQHAYPRSPNPDIKWRVVASRAFEWVYYILPCVLLWTRFLRPLCQQVGRRPLTVDDLTNVFLLTSVGSLLKVVGLGLLYFEHFCNMTAELLRFGDRQFYRNYWICKNMIQYLRHWNLIVKHWITDYLYAAAATSAHYW